MVENKKIKVELIKVEEGPKGEIMFRKIDGSIPKGIEDPNAVMVLQRIDWVKNGAEAIIARNIDYIGGKIVRYSCYTELEELVAQNFPNARIAMINKIG